MKLPISFDEVSYFNNEYRGDLIVTKGVLYYFPHTRVIHARYADELGGKETMPLFDLLGNLAPIFGTVPWIRTSADKSVKLGKFLKRTFRPTTNSPRIRKIHLWRGNDTNEKLQIVLDEYIEKVKKDRLEFDDDSVPKPMRFSTDEIGNARFGLKFRFDAKYDNHDFRVNLIHRSLLKKALQEGGIFKSDTIKNCESFRQVFGTEI
ncbi:MAG: hypothetical protein H0X15_03385 [Acidobacteria bacterium]|jgi:hypothetical protein|nr:hypothetical protein [Acidobacteriota bacterium]MBA4184844.1 hypothetical protein [Acidobacteriota bacterium]HEV8159312.1 hypothetical protein [Pyrinomonadaceae bacterium]